MDFAKILHDLNIDPKLLLINALGFGLLFLLANKLVFKPIGKALDDRDSEISGIYDRLDADQQQMATLKAEYEARLTAIESEAREKIQTAIKEAQTARDQILADANQRSREIIAHAEQEADREKEQAMITLRQQIVDLAVNTTTRVVGESLDAKRHQQLIDEFIAQGAAEA